LFGEVLEDQEGGEYERHQLRHQGNQLAGRALWYARARMVDFHPPSCRPRGLPPGTNIFAGGLTPADPSPLLLTYGALVPLMGTVPRLARAADEITPEKADYTLRIDTGLVEMAPDHIVSTTLPISA
jgi:hypothetical protein